MALKDIKGFEGIYAASDDGNANFTAGGTNSNFLTVKTGNSVGVRTSTNGSLFDSAEVQVLVIR